MKNGAEDIASLIESLDHPNRAVVRAAVDSLVALGPGPEIQQALNKLLNDSSRKIRWPIAYTLAQLSFPSSQCLEVLIEGLGSEDQDIRWATLLLTARLGKSDERIVSLLLGLLKTGSSIQRRMAVYCLRDMDLKDAESLQALMESLRDPDPLVRVAAVTSLKGRPEVGQEGGDLLLHLFLKDPDPRVRHTAALTLAQLGDPTEEIRAALKDASRGDDPQLKKAANAALDLLQKKGPALPAK